ncbi:hypothetical protein KM043_002357 [Ampulex compressa]|nr:hypothetical protein KM043_002357 [Ampulex compressa]
MGKNKQAQRTKNNARPANSSYSAEILGSAIPNFVGFSAVKNGGYIPILPGLSICDVNEVEMNNIDSNFQIVLKKINKKDATTKYKALLEFATLCKESELSAVEGILSFWPRVYCALAIDVEHRVREAAQLAHASLVKRVGRSIAVYLKQLAGAWFTSQYDTYPPAASAATNSFNETFPQKKSTDAIIHCQREILTYISDNIIVQTPESLSVQKSLTAQEMEAKYQKVLIASLQGYSFYLKKVPVQEIEKTAEIHGKIVTSSKFWKLLKQDALPIKTAFFNVLTSMIENAGFLLQEEKKRTVTTIMNSLDETEPGLLAAVWESVLVAINKIEDWYLVVSIEKLVLPKLWRVLKNGGQNCATIVYPNLLPFISQFPKLKIDTNNLYTNFFNNMREGFSVKSVQMSRSEMFAVTTSFVECIRYSILLNASNEELCIKLLKEQLMPVLEQCLKENVPIKKIFFCEVTHLIRYWSKNRENEEYKSYACLIQEFWVELKTLIESLVDLSDDSTTSQILNINNSQIELLHNLKNAPVHIRKNLNVKFSDSEEKLETQIRTKSAEENASILELYDKTLKHWLLNNTVEREETVQLIFNLIKYLNDAEKNQVLKSLIELDDNIIIRNIVQCGLSKNYRNDVVIKKWCSQDKTTGLLVDVASELALSKYSDWEKNKNLILLAFETSDDGDLLISETGANEIVSILCDSVNKVDQTFLIQFTRLISCIVPLIWAHKRPTSGAIQILETLFELCTRDCFDSDMDFANEIRAVCKKGLEESIQKLEHEKFIALTKKLASIVWARIYNLDTPCIKDILVDLAADLLEVIVNNSVNMKVDHAREIVLTFLAESGIKTWLSEVAGIVIYAEIITGNLHISNPDQNIQICQSFVPVNLLTKGTHDNIENCLVWSVFATMLLNNLYSRQDKEDVESSDEFNVQETVPLELDLPGITDMLMNIVLSTVLGNMYCRHYKSTQHYSNVHTHLEQLKYNFKMLQKYFTDNMYDKIQQHIKTNSSNYGCIFPYIVSFYCTELCPNNSSVESFVNYRTTDTYAKDDESHIEMDLQRIQILSQYLKLEDISIPLDDDLTALIVARSMLAGQADMNNYVTILEKIIPIEGNEYDMPRLNCDLKETPWKQLSLHLEVMRLFTELVTRIPTKLTDSQWKFCFISLGLCQESINKSRINLKNFKVTTLIIAVCQLYHAIQSLIHEHKREEKADLHPASLYVWKQLFMEDIQSGILRTWMFYADLLNNEATALQQVIVLDYMGSALNLIYGKIVFEEQFLHTLEKSTVNLKDLIKLALRLLQSSSTSIQLGAYHALKHIVPELVERDKALIESENFDTNNLNIRKLEEVLKNTQNIVNTILSDFKLCDTVSCTIQPFTDSYTYAVGYLLAWAIVLDMCAHAHGDLRYQYAETLKDDFFPSLLNNIFRLMPVEVLQDNKNKTVKVVEIFSTVPSLNFGESWTESRLDHVVCWLYTNCLRHLPVLVRQWWNAADSRVSTAVDKITTHYVSPMLCQEELLNNRLGNIENMQVKIHPTVREVVALYQMDDSKLELSIVLAPNHPLGLVTVEPRQQAGGTANWRNCHMQLPIFLTHQNGSVWDGLLLWKRNLDKKFAGVEECYICFSIFHISTYEIPKVLCHTCRKKFHTPCLYKWFNTSRKSTCPVWIFLFRSYNGNCSNMFSTQLIRHFKIPNITRRLNTSSIMREGKEPTIRSEADRKLVEDVIGTKMHKVSNFDRWILVWVKRYPNKAAVPEKVTMDCIVQANSRARIRTCNIMIVATIIMCICTVISGKTDKSVQDSIMQKVQKDTEEQQRILERGSAKL